MKRLALIAAGVVVAGGVAATPAVAGLAGNSSFSHELPVPVPSAAKTPLFADTHSPAGATAPATAATERGDDRGGVSRHAEPGDDHGGLNPAAEPGDDHGGLNPAAEPGDDHGDSHGGSVDDHGGSRGGRG